MSCRCRGMHPYVTGLSVIGGMYWLGLEGALIGPLILCSFLVLLNLYSQLAVTWRPTPTQKNSLLVYLLLRFISISLFLSLSVSLYLIFSFSLFPFLYFSVYFCLSLSIISLSHPLFDVSLPLSVTQPICCFPVLSRIPSQFGRWSLLSFLELFWIRRMKGKMQDSTSAN